MRRRNLMLMTGALGAVGVGLWAYTRYRERLSFYANLMRVYLTSHRRYLTDPAIHRDIVFDARLAPRLDVYQPTTPGPHPVLIFIHGGSWTSYPKPWFAPLGLILQTHNIVTVIPDYTLYPHATYRQMAHEVAAAIAWTLEHIADYGGNPRHVFLAGHSAGGHLAGLVACDPRYLAEVGHEVRELCGLIGMSGVYNVEAEYRFFAHQRAAERLLRGVFEGDKHFAYASPEQYVRADLPPVLLIHGDADDVVPYAIGEAFHAALQQAGATSTFKRYAQAGHVDYLFEALRNPRAPILTDILEFIAAHPPH